MVAPPPTYQFMQCTNATKCCNGLTSNCDLKVTDIMFAGIHNGQAAAQTGYRLAPNQLYSLESALDYGYRAINMDMGICDGELKLVHGFCKLGTRDPFEVFSNISNWLNNNPTEVLLIPTEINDEAGGGDVKLSDIYEVFSSIEGFTDKLYSKGSDPKWPTMQELIESNRRVMFLTYNGQNCYDSGVVCPPGIMDYFRYATETEYSFSSVDEISNVSKSCYRTRGRPLAPFFGINMFVTLPDMEAAAVVNQKDYIQNHIEECSRFNNRTANAVYVDFWNEGDLPEVVQLHNKQIAIQLQNDTGKR